jgi:hypothetical protein
MEEREAILILPVLSKRFLDIYGEIINIANLLV